ncbi:AMP-binding protein [Ancylobacter rudongensis]|uniref:Acyl-CoA synthetase (AMP-forming)/AMP-acid ligase II n=1 Tax=Ancylobacter rudongensis TaxID=177413 RepID=A0A1G4UJI7_9HYPH|nr:AMP-binding protein [Ancylobacter rudongensis]SCW93801.1 Acyl-CoA synthetase (AMP-forming)/AMP-acid ligase II [Ancylobacter rudongensis]
MNAVLPAGTIATRLAALAESPEDRWSITFLDSHGAVFERCGAAELAARAARVAGFLERESAPGAPVLLVFQPCVDFLVAFLACQWSGRLAVPINPPRRHRLIQRLQAVATDSGAAIALTGGGVAEQSALWQADSPELAAIRWQDVGDIDSDPAQATPLRAVDPTATCFIQYTSGSTALPKGVEVSHANLMADMARMEEAWGLSPASTMVTWLPAFHDLGLIFGLLQTLYSGCPVVQMAPNSFLQRPLLWLEAISRFRGTHTAAPSFAYDLCARRIPPEARAGLDLASLVMAMNAAEPIDPQVMEDFITAFGPHGFRRETFAPAYGLAESTLAVTASPVGVAPRLFPLDAAALEAGRIAEAGAASRRHLIPGSGAPLPDVAVAIVDPETGRRQPPDRVGEIWLGGPTIAGGYWRRPEESAATFGVRVADEDEPTGYLRTGDLGALIDGELCVTGRIKDLIILSGANHYPQDIERVAQGAHPALRAGGGAAFGLVGEAGGEQVVLVQELERTQRRTDPAPLFGAISAAVWQTLELQLSRIVLVEPGAVLRTSSGKIQRAANRQAWREGALPVIAEWRSARQEALDAAREPQPAAPARALAMEAPALEHWLRDWLAGRLALPASAVPVDRGVGELGLTSLDAVDLAGALGTHLGRALPQTLAFDHPTIAAMVAHLTGVPPASPAQASPSIPAPPPGAGGDLEELLSLIEGGARGHD